MHGSCSQRRKAHGFAETFASCTLPALLLKEFKAESLALAHSLISAIPFLPDPCSSLSELTQKEFKAEIQQPKKIKKAVKLPSNWTLKFKAQLL